MTDFSQLVDQLSPRLLQWAWSKTGSHEQATELTQEVWLQFLNASRREEAANRPLREPERFLWRVARFTWLKQLRQLTAEFLAFHDDTLYHPVDKRDGEFLTMAYIHRT